MEIYTEKDRLRTFLASLGDGSGEDEILEGIRREAVRDGVPVIRPGMRSLLRTLLAAAGPERILEVGTAVGYSALWMAGCAPEGCRILTVENYEKRIKKARENFALHPLGNRISLLEGDAAGILPGLVQAHEQFDFIFMDAAKGQYPALLPLVKKMVRDGGMIVTDNVLQEGDILESRYAVKRRDRTIHRRMREYLYALTHDEELVTTILETGDGAAVTVKRKPGKG